MCNKPVSFRSSIAHVAVLTGASWHRILCFSKKKVTFVCERHQWRNKALVPYIGTQSTSSGADARPSVRSTFSLCQKRQRQRKMQIRETIPKRAVLVAHQNAVFVAYQNDRRCCVTRRVRQLHPIRHHIRQSTFHQRHHLKEIYTRKRERETLFFVSSHAFHTLPF